MWYFNEHDTVYDIEVKASMENGKVGRFVVREGGPTSRPLHRNESLKKYDKESLFVISNEYVWNKRRRDCTEYATAKRQREIAPVGEMQLMAL